MPSLTSKSGAVSERNGRRRVRRFGCRATGWLALPACASVLLLATLTAAPALAQHADEPVSPVDAHLAPADPETGIRRLREPAGRTLPLAATRHITFDTDEGTWLSLDRSPDGRTIVFDLLGDIYSLNANGGRARPIATGLAFETQPTFSPDGRTIAFISDRSGADNLWLAGPDGSNPRQISFGDDDTVLVSPAWTPDGRSLFVSRYRPSLNAYELWRYGLDGSSELIVPIKPQQGSPRSAYRTSLGAVASPDGRFVYFARQLGSPSFDTPDEWTIVRRDLQTGSETTIVAEPDGPRKGLHPGQAFRPVLSPDGRTLVYATRHEGQTGLRVRDLSTGDDRWLAFPIEHDQLQASTWQDIVPRYAFTPDGAALLVARGGHIARIEMPSGKSSIIPFTAHVDVPLGPLARVSVPDETGPVRARIIQSPEQSPDGRTLAFSALSHVYVMPLNGTAAPRRLTSGVAPEFQPSWSPDGRRITFVTWTETGAGDIWIAPADTSAPPRRISHESDFYTNPVFTRDGASILAERSPQRDRLHLYMEYGKLREADLVLLSATSGEQRLVTHGMLGGKPHWSAAPDHAWLLFAEGLAAVNLATGARDKPLAVQGPGWYFQDGPQPVSDIRISPDGRWALAQVAQQLHLIELGGEQPDRPIDLSQPGLRHRRLTATGADFFEWADGGRTITWALGSTFYRRPLAGIALDPADRPGWTPDDPAPGRGGVKAFDVPVTVPRDRPEGNLLLTGARAITERGDEVIERADILIAGDRIAAIGPAGSLTLPPGTAVRDLTGKTIVPGFIDVHDHIATIRREVLGLEDWGLRERLAFGITTSFDPSTLSIDMFAYQDMLDAGLMLGPRLPSTGTALFSWNRLASLDDALAVERRYRDFYRTHNLKQYRIGSRIQRQWTVMAASRLGMVPTCEGALSLKLDLTQIIDGYSGNEHSLATPLYRDVIQLLARSRTSNDTTLQITNGGFEGQDYFLTRDNPLHDAKFRHFTPPFAADQIALHREWRPLSEYQFPRFAADSDRMQKAGGLLAVGAHGEVPGRGFHWELEAYAMGGMTPADILRAATIGGAEAIGRAGQIGSLEPGKYADLVILDRNPSADITATRAVAQVMKNGRLYAGATLAEEWPRREPAPARWFAVDMPPGTPTGTPPR